MLARAGRLMAPVLKVAVEQSLQQGPGVIRQIPAAAGPEVIVRIVLLERLQGLIAPAAGLLHLQEAILRAGLLHRQEAILRAGQETVHQEVFLQVLLHLLPGLIHHLAVVVQEAVLPHQEAAGLLHREETKLKNKTYEIVRGGSSQQLAHPFYI